MAKSVIHIAESAENAATGICKMVKALCETEESSIIIFGTNGPWMEEFRNADIRVRFIPAFRGRRAIFALPKLWMELRRSGSDIAHIHCQRRAVSMIARLAGLISVVHLHGRVWESSLEPQPSEISWADYGVAFSSAVAQHFRVGSKTPAIIHPGVPIASTNPRPEPMLIGAAGRLVSIKGFEYLLRAMPGLPQVTLEIAGDGPLLPSLMQLCEDLGISSRVKFLRWVNHLPTVMARWQAAIVPSLEEGFGLVALEAIALGVPVVASNVGGLPEIIEHGRNGYLVPARSPQALAEAIHLLIADERKQRAMANEARFIAELRFSPKTMNEHMQRFYDEIRAARIRR